MKGYYQILGCNGNMYYSYVKENDTPASGNEIIARCSTEEDAQRYIQRNKSIYFIKYQKSQTNTFYKNCYYSLL
jgi:hypothetical protein